MSPIDESWLTEALATRDLDRIRPSMSAAGERINEARRHIRSARVVAPDDPTLAIAACHDAVRKAITAHMVAGGLRPRSGDGSHRLVLEYARHVLSGILAAADLRDAEDLRRDRALAEYGNFATSRFGAVQVEAAADLAERIANAVAKELARRPRARDSAPLATRSTLEAVAPAPRPSRAVPIPGALPRARAQRHGRPSSPPAAIE